MDKIIFICFVLLAGCQKQEPPVAMVPEVSTYIVEVQTIPANFEFMGVAESSHLVEIWSRVEGYLWKIAYKEGALVKEDDLLFQIDPRQFQAEVDEAKGAVAREEAVLWAAEQAVARFTPLYERKAASKRDLDNATAEELAGVGSVESAKANLVKAQLNLSYTAITSPIAGLTTRSKYREGTLINPGVNGLLTTVSVLDPIWVIFSVSDFYLLASKEELAKKQLIYPKNEDFDVTVVLSDGSEFPYKGKVNFASPILDQSTGTMTVRAEFPNPQNELRPGQFVRATVRGATRPNAIVVPQESVQQGAKGMFVYVVNDEDVAEIRYVEVGTWYNQSWVIKSGLEEGDEVIVNGVNKVRNGSPVKVASKPKTKNCR